MHRRYTLRGYVKEALIKLITFIVRQSHHEHNQYVTVRPEPVEGFNQRLLKETLNNCHFERSEKSMVLIAKDSSLCSE